MSSLPQVLSAAATLRDADQDVPLVSMTKNGHDLAVSGEAVVAFGRDMRVASWNAAAEQLTGIEAGDAIG
jgi:PAS domain-containing protein